MNDVTVTICYLVSNGNDVTVTVCGNDAHLWLLGHILLVHNMCQIWLCAGARFAAVSKKCSNVNKMLQIRIISPGSDRRYHIENVGICCKKNYTCSIYIYEYRVHSCINSMQSIYCIYLTTAAARGTDHSVKFIHINIVWRLVPGSFTSKVIFYSIPLQYLCRYF
jgi:hypothetical protein